MSDVFELPAELTIYSALQTRDALLAWTTAQSAQSNAELKFSAANVSSIDGAGLQLLAALGNMGLSWQVIEASPVFIETCQRMGLQKWLASVHSSSSGVAA